MPVNNVTTQLAKIPDFKLGDVVVIKDIGRHLVTGDLHISDISDNRYVVTVRQEGTNIYYELLASQVVPKKREELL